MLPSIDLRTTGGTRLVLRAAAAEPRRAYARLKLSGLAVV